MKSLNKKRRDTEPGWSWDGDKLRNWRMTHKTPIDRITNYLRVSQATYYRYESGIVPPVDIANGIVHITRGAIRYRDMFPQFNVKYA